MVYHIPMVRAGRRGSTVLAIKTLRHFRDSDEDNELLNVLLTWWARGKTRRCSQETGGSKEVTAPVAQLPNDHITGSVFLDSNRVKYF